MRFSSSFKVGLLTLISLIILVFSILWIKGRALSAGERITIQFKDVNGMRPGSGVQLMGFRVGQVEEITPVLNNEKSFINVKFVITEKDIEIPDASIISIQQSGLIGEQFLEITPPIEKFIYLPAKNTDKQILHAEDSVMMTLSDKLYKVGVIKDIKLVKTDTIPLNFSKNIKTKDAYKIGYIINLPGLILKEEDLQGDIIASINGKEDDEVLHLKYANGQVLEYPISDSKYTIIEPLRLSDFMELQYKAAESLFETNEKISSILSDQVIADLQESAMNLRILTCSANTTLEKAQVLIDSSREDLDELMKIVNRLSDKMIILTDNINNIVGDEEFKISLMSTMSNVDRLSCNINNILEDQLVKDTLKDINVTSKNLAQISSYINDATQDAKLKDSIQKTVTKFNIALDKLAITLETVNDLTVNEKDTIKCTLVNANKTASNLRKFSEKLNKRFLLFRLLF